MMARACRHLCLGSDVAPPIKHRDAHLCALLWCLDAGREVLSFCDKHNLLRGTGDLGTSSMWCRWAGYPESVYMAEVKS